MASKKYTFRIIKTNFTYVEAAVYLGAFNRSTNNRSVVKIEVCRSKDNAEELCRISAEATCASLNASLKG